jgi:hypothetical protein
MADRINEKPDGSISGQGNSVAAMVVTFVLLFLLAAIVWFVLDRIRTDELRAIEISQAAHGQAHAQNIHASPRDVARK